MKFTINPKKVLRSLLIIIFCLLILHIVVVYLKLFRSDIGLNKNILIFFDFDWERNLPTFYSSLALFTSGVLLFVISRIEKVQKKQWLHWIGLSLIFVFLAIDEYSSIHEQLEMPTKSLIDATGLLYYAWYIPYGILLLILTIVYAKFLLGLPKRVLYLFILAGLVFVFGAVGFEAISGYHDEINGIENLTYNVLITFEELFEMCGVAIFIYALLIYISGEAEELSIKVA